MIDKINEISFWLGKNPDATEEQFMQTRSELDKICSLNECSYQVCQPVNANIMVDETNAAPADGVGGLSNDVDNSPEYNRSSARGKRAADGTDDCAVQSQHKQMNFGIGV